jgi:general secretion pathway protein L
LRETLYIRLRAVEPDAQTSYCVAAAGAIASFPVQQAPLETVLAAAGTRRIVVLVPGADVRLAQVTVPARQPSKVLLAAPYALEDQLAEDVDTLHFALGTRTSEGAWPVAVVARERMDGWLQPFVDRGLKPDALIPETQCLPGVDHGRWSALAEPAQVTVRTGAYAGFACVPEDLPLFLQLADPDKKALLRVVVARDFTGDLSRLEWPVELLPGFTAPLEALLQNLSLERVTNLLQGAYSQREDLARAWRPWRPSAALLGTWLLLAGAWHGVEAFKLQRELTTQDEANAQRYQQLFPADSRIVDLPEQLSRQITALRGGGSHGGLLPLAQTLGGALGAVQGLSVQSLQFREGVLTADLTASDLQRVDQLRNWFGGQNGPHLDVLAADSGAEGVKIRIKLTPAAG